MTVIHIHVVRTSLSATFRAAVPHAKALYRVHQANKMVSRKRSLGHQDKGNKSFLSSSTGTVPTMREWWQ